METIMSVHDVRLSVETGTVWVTKSGEPLDQIVGEGKTVDLVGPGWIVGPVNQRQPGTWRVTGLRRSRRP